MREEPIVCSFCASEEYAQHLAVVVASILAHTPHRRFTFHVLTKGYTEETLHRLRAMEDERCQFAFHLVDRSRFEGFPIAVDYTAIESYFRYLVPEVLEGEHRVIHMDVDVLVVGSLEPLWETDLEGCPAGAVEDGKEETEVFRQCKLRLGMQADAQYFNAGVLLMDLEGLRAERFTEQCIAYTQTHREVMLWQDQDAINAVLEGRIKSIPMVYNCMTPSRLPRGTRPVIRHFAAFSSKPWCCLPKNRTWPAYVRVLLKTPYRDKAWGFIWAHVRGLFFFRYTRKGIERIFLCGILVWRKKQAQE